MQRARPPRKKLSFSASQYFEVKIEYVELTPEEFTEKVSEFANRLENMFVKKRRLEDEVKLQLKRIHHE